MRLIFAMTALLVSSMALAADSSPVPQTPTTTPEVPLQVSPAPPPASFAYVLQADGLAKSREKVVATLAGCGRDWMVLDASFDGAADGRWTSDEIKTIRAGKAGRQVLAYLSIGEAEDYRSYWKKEWDADHNGKPDQGAPAWLGMENPDWKGNYKVHYWDPAWQAIMLKDVETIAKAGFDGIYLDIVDAFEYYEYDEKSKDWIDNRVNSLTGKTYRQEMIAWVGRIAETGRKVNPAFMVIPQNGSPLLENKPFVALIDAIGVEDLFTDGDKRQSGQDIKYRLGFLKQLQAAGKPVLLIEYGSKPASRQRSVKGAQDNGLILLLTDRELRTLGQPPANEAKAKEPQTKPAE